MKAAGLIAKWIFILCMPFLLLTAGIGWVANSAWFYEHGFAKYQVSDTTGLAEEELEKVAHGLIGYFNSDEEYLTLTVTKDGEPFTLFNQREIDHLKDVKGLIRLDYWVMAGTFAYVLGYTAVSLSLRRRDCRRRLAGAVVGGSAATLLLVLALGLVTLFDFDRFFWQFHVFSFANDLWKLDPSRDYLIMLFPQGFFYDATLLAAGTAAGLALVFGIAGGIYRWRRG